jgi:hypothetical protein
MSGVLAGGVAVARQKMNVPVRTFPPPAATCTRKHTRSGKQRGRQPEAFSRPNSMKTEKDIGRGEWIRTTGLLVPNQAAFSNSLIIEQIFLQNNSS